MASVANKIVIDKLAVITFDVEVSESGFRGYLVKDLETLTFGLNHGSTILFIGVTHGDKSVKLVPVESIQSLKNQVRILKYL